MTSSLLKRRTPIAAASSLASQQHQNHHASQIARTTIPANPRASVVLPLPKPLGSKMMPLLPTQLKSRNAMITPLSQPSVHHPDEGKFPVVEYPALVQTSRVKPLSPSPRPTECMCPTGWEAFLKEHAAVNFFLMPESAKQSAYLDSSIIWGQIASDIFRGVKARFRQWRIARNSRKGTIPDKFISTDIATLPKIPREELDALTSSNFMDALLFTGPFNFMPGQDDHLGKTRTPPMDAKV